MVSDKYAVETNLPNSPVIKKTTHIKLLYNNKIASL